MLNLVLLTWYNKRKLILRARKNAKILLIVFFPPNHAQVNKISNLWTKLYNSSSLSLKNLSSPSSNISRFVNVWHISNCKLTQSPVGLREHLRYLRDLSHELYLEYIGSWKQNKQFKTIKVIQGPFKSRYLTPGSKLMVLRSFPTSPDLKWRKF